MTTIAVIIVLGFAAWRISLRFWPYTYCRRCEGGGRNEGSTRKRWGSCRKCGGSGWRERAGLHWFSTGGDR